MALMTVGSLKARLMNLLVDAVQVESDPGNAQMLLGGLLLAVQHSAACDQNDQPDTSCNLFSSGLPTYFGFLGETVIVRFLDQ